MARPLELIIEIKGKEAKSFIAKMANPPKNPAREDTLKRVLAMKKRLTAIP